jgi:4-aminobutyrate aminotransferase-like enzyme
MRSDKTVEALAAARRDLIGRNVRTSYRKPLHIVRASMQYLYDDTGRPYIDGYNNVPHVGRFAQQWQFYLTPPPGGGW